MGWVGVWGLNHGVRPIWFWKRQLTQELPFPTGLTLHLLFSLSPISQRPQYLHLSQHDQFLHTIQKWIQELLIHINGAVIQEKKCNNHVTTEHTHVPRRLCFQHPHCHLQWWLDTPAFPHIVRHSEDWSTSISDPRSLLPGKNKI